MTKLIIAWFTSTRGVYLTDYVHYVIRTLFRAEDSLLLKAFSFLWKISTQVLPQGGGSCKVRAVVHVRLGRWFVSGQGGGSCQGVRVTYRSSMPELKNWHGREQIFFSTDVGRILFQMGRMLFQMGRMLFQMGRMLFPDKATYRSSMPELKKSKYLSI